MLAATENPNVFGSNLIQNQQPSGLPSLNGQSASEHLTNTGAFAYTIPIVTPPGRNELNPNLALSYNSQNKDDHHLFGFGWSHNIPYITRDNKTGVNSMYNDFYFSSSLSGSLQPRSDAITSPFQIYTPEVADADIIVYTFNSDNSWTAKDKRGWTYTFGQTDDARLSDTPNSTTTATWYLEKIEDRNANNIHYEYDRAGKQIYPKEIYYTGHQGANGDYKIELAYASRTPFTNYYPGFEVSTDQVVDNINVYFEDNLIRRYDLNHTISEDSGRSLLTSYQITGFDGVDSETLPPEHFEYSKSNFHFEKDTSIAVYPPQLNSLQLFDNIKEQQPSTAAELNGNGIPEFYSWEVFNTGSSFEDHGWEYHAGTNQWLNVGGARWLFEPEKSKALDRDGDFRHDTIVLTSSSLNDLPFSNQDPANTVKFADANGDDISDVFAHEQNLYFGDIEEGWVEYSNPGFNVQIDMEHIGQNRLIDWNRDGLVDILDAKQNRIIINEGLKSWKDIGQLPQIYSFYEDALESVSITDVNNDGISDYIFSLRDSPFDINNIYVSKIDHSFELSDQVLPTNLSRLYQDEEIIGNGAWLYDFNNDGVDDIFRAREGGVWEVWINKTQPADVLVNVQTAQGASIATTYERTTQHRDDQGALRNPDLYTPMLVVSSISINDGAGDPDHRTYRYENGHFIFPDNIRKKFAGFEVISEIDHTRGGLTKTYYHQGDDTNTGLGEPSDQYELAGRIYKKEFIDNNTDSVLRTEYQNWSVVDHSVYSGIPMVVLVDKINTNHSDDGQTRSSAQTMEWNGRGDLNKHTQWGEVSYDPNTGQISDIGDDYVLDQFTYNNNASTLFLTLVTEQKTFNKALDVLKWQRSYFDELALYNVANGNLTTLSDWDDNNNQWLNRDFDYNQQGLVIADTDPRGNQTSFQYDTHELAIDRTINALGHTTDYDYDYAVGKRTKVSDPNGVVQRTVFDPLGRKVREYRSGPSGFQVKVAEWDYDTLDLPFKTTETRYLTDQPIEIVEYHDGLGRSIQRKEETSQPGIYSTVTRTFDALGRLHSETVPYPSNTDDYDATIYVATTTSFTLQPSEASSKDTYNGTSNLPLYGGQTASSLIVRNISPINKGFSYLQFDLGDAPFDATEAKIHLFNQGAQSHLAVGNPEIELRLPTEPWGENLGGFGGPNSDFYMNLDAPVGQQWYTIDISDLYNEWTDGTRENYGILLVAKTGGSTIFASSNHTDATLWPKLEVQFDPSSDPVNNQTVYGTFYEYDILDRPIKTVQPSGTTRHQYDLWTRTTTNKNGVPKTFHFDARDNLTRVDEYNSGDVYSTVYDYDPLNRLTRITDAEGNRRTHTYDSLGREVATTLPHRIFASVNPKIMDYDSTGNLVRELLPDGKEILYSYDELNRLVSKTNPNDQTVDVAYQYDTGQHGIGLLAREEATHYAKQYDYNEAGTLAQEGMSFDHQLASTTAPSIQILGDNPLILTVGDQFQDPGAEATDQQDGDISSSITSSSSVIVETAGTYAVYYSVTNSADLTTVAQRSVIIETDSSANQPPIVTLLGDNPTTVQEGDAFIDPGATASDPEDGDLTTAIVVSGAVDTTTAGTYTLTYSATDSQSQTAEDQRTVLVEEVVPDPDPEPGANTHSLSVSDNTGLMSATDYTAVSGGNAMTVELWINTSGGNSQPSLPISVNDGAASTFHIVNSPVGYKFAVQTDTGFYESAAIPTASVEDGTWHHVAGVYDGSDVRIYLDGLPQGSDVAANGTINSDNPTKLGINMRVPASGSPQLFLSDAKIDEIRIWDIARSQTQIADNKDAELAGSEDNLISYWQLDNDGTDTAGSYDLTDYGTPSYLTEPAFSDSSSSGGSSGGGSGSSGGSGNPTSANTHSLSVSDNTGLMSATDYTAVSGGNAMTVELWINTSGGNSQPSLPISVNDGAASTFHIVNSPVGYKFAVQTDTGFYESAAIPTASVEDGTWHHVAGVYDGSDVRIYLDGLPQGSDVAANGTINSDNPTKLGINMRVPASGSPQLFLSDAKIDEIRIWDIARSQTQIADNKDAELAGSEDNLISYWQLDNDGTDTAGSYDLTDYGTPSYLTEPAFSDSSSSGGSSGGGSGSSGGSGNPTSANTHSLSVSDNTGLMSATDYTAVSGGNAMTVELWINTSGGNSQPSLPISVNDGAASTFHIVNSPVGYKFAVQTDTGFYESAAIPTASVEDGTWHHVAGVYDGSDVRIYLDGLPQGSDVAANGTINSDNPTKLGINMRVPASGSPQLFLSDAKIDEIRIWDIARSQTQIADNKDAELAGSEDNLISYWQLDNDGTDTAGSYDLTDYGTPSYVTNSAFSFTIFKTIFAQETTHEPEYLTKYDYSEYGALTDITYPDNVPLSYTYNRAGTIDSISLGTTSILTSSSYNHIGQVTERQHANGIVEAYEYDPTHQFRLSRKTAYLGNDVLQDLSLTLDPEGNPTVISDSGEVVPQTIVAQYDDLDRLIRSDITVGVNTDIHEFVYSPIGNILSYNSQSYSYDDDRHPHAATSYEGTATDYNYDPNGNLISTTNSSEDRTYHRDAFDRLSQINLDGDAIFSATYNGDRQRVAKSSPDSDTVHYLNRYVEIDGETIKRQVFSGVHRVATLQGDIASHRIQDPLLSASILTDDNGEVTSSGTYSPFGLPSGSIGDRYTFTDQEADASSDLMYFDSRYYDPNLRQFVSADPWFGDQIRPRSLNKYAYAVNNPYRYVDPSGENPLSAFMTGYRIHSAVSDPQFIVETGQAVDILANQSYLFSEAIDHPYITSASLAVTIPATASLASTAGFYFGSAFLSNMVAEQTLTRILTGTAYSYLAAKSATSIDDYIHTSIALSEAQLPVQDGTLHLFDTGTMILDPIIPEYISAALDLIQLEIDALNAIKNQ